MLYRLNKNYYVKLFICVYAKKICQLAKFVSVLFLFTWQWPWKHLLFPQHFPFITRVPYITLEEKASEMFCLLNNTVICRGTYRINFSFWSKMSYVFCRVENKEREDKTANQVRKTLFEFTFSFASLFKLCGQDRFKCVDRCSQAISGLF